MNTKYDVIVIGLGAMGSATAAHLARRGAAVLGLDATGAAMRWDRRTARAASSAKPTTRRRNTCRWYNGPTRSGASLEAESGQQLLDDNRRPESWLSDGSFVDGSIRSASLNGLQYELLTAARSRRGSLASASRTIWWACSSRRRGSCIPERCVGAHLDTAIEHGAEIVHGFRCSGTP